MQKPLEKEDYRKRIIEIVEGIENNGKLKFILSILESYLEGRG